MNSVETYRGFVYPWVIDHIGHMNVQSYVARFDEASWHFLAHLGLTPTLLKQSRKSFVALEQTTKYGLEVLEGSLLHIKTELLDLQRKTIRYRHRMFNSENRSEVARMELLVLYFDTELRRAAELPSDLRARVDSAAPGGAAQP